MNTIEPLLQSCSILTGIGSQLSEKLQNIGIFNLYDLLLHLPFRYQDRSHITAIGDLSLHQPAVIQGIIIESHWLNGNKKVYHCALDDGTGVINLRFFHMPPYQQKRLQKNTTLKAIGDVLLKAHGFEMSHPEIEVLQPGKAPNIQAYLTAWYPSTKGIHQNMWRKIMTQLFTAFKAEINALEWLDAAFLQQHGLLSLAESLHVLHFPTLNYQCDELILADHPAHKRLAFEELVSYSLSTKLLKQQNQTFKAYPYPTPDNIDQSLLETLPFELTDAQKKVITEIRHDLHHTQPMLRLLQGDVGSGKTIVCALISLAVLAAKHQVALMAPTDLLSEQHFSNMQKWLEPLGYRVLRLNRTTGAKEKKTTYQALANGEGHVVVGTHALFQDKVQFQNLGLVMIDEQHRFGVAQRLKLTEKANSAFHPHQLFVTATPIPRTLSMTQFSHFDVSIINQLPKGRKPIQTAIMSHEKRDAIIERLQEILNQKGQIYWVCTRIEEDETTQQQATQALQDYLNTQLPAARIGMVHGKLKPQEKDAMMQAFKTGEIDILVATTVIEVGVDVPNANIIIIENAERLGLAQLHQLRGRVGRGQEDAFCILMYTPPLSENGQKRLQIIRQSNDGFWLAEQDLLIRGSGDIFGTQQTGFKEFKLAKIPQHIELLKLGQSLAKDLLEQESPVVTQLLRYWYCESQRFLKA